MLLTRLSVPTNRAALAVAYSLKVYVPGNGTHNWPWYLQHRACISVQRCAKTHVQQSVQQMLKSGTAAIPKAKAACWAKPRVKEESGTKLGQVRRRSRRKTYLAAKSVLRVVGRPDQLGAVVVDQWFSPCSYTANVA